MSTSGTFGFAMSTGELVMQAFRRIGVPRNKLSAEMMLDARTELNLIGSAWANNGPNLWAVDQQTVALVPGTTTYSIDPATIDVLDARITLASGTDLVLAPIGRSDYASYPNKAQPGRPTTFWFDRLTAPTLTVWPVPETGSAYVLTFFRARQTQDAVIAGGSSPDVPYRFLDALCWALAESLSYLYASDKTPLVGARAQSALREARAEDTEDVPTTFSPALGAYFRR